MADIPLIVQADTSSVVKGKADLAGFKEALGGVKTQTEAVTGASQRGTGATRTYTESQRQGSRAANEATRAAREQAAAIDRVGQAYRFAKGAIAGFIGMAIVRDLQNTTMTLQKINMTFTAVTGSAAAARQEMDYVRETADRLGQDVLTAAGAYSKLLAATKGTNITLEESRTVFEGITAAATAYGLSQYELEGALMAVQQMISKGSVQAEELRGQLGERLPGAFQIAARAMGMSTQELSKALELGQVAADDFVRAFGAQLQQEFAGFASQTRTTATAISELENSMLALKEAVIAGGFQRALFTVLEALNRLAQSQAAVAAAEALGAAFNMLADIAAYLLGIIEKVANSDMLAGVFTLIANNVELATVAVVALYTAMKTGLLTTMAAAVVQAGSLAGVFSLIVTSAASAAGAVAGFIVALGPIGWAITAVTALGAAFFLLRDSTKDLQTAQRDVQTSMQGVVEVSDKLTALNNTLIQQHRDLGTAAAEGSAAQEAASRVAIDRTLEEIRVQNQLLETRRQVMIADQAALKASIEESRGGLGDLARDALQGTAKNRGDVQRFGLMGDQEAIAAAQALIEKQQALNETLSDRERIFLNESAALAEAEQAYIDNGNAITQMGDAMATAAEEQAKLLNETKRLAEIKEGFANAVNALDDMVWSMGLVASDAQALQAALDAAFAAETPQQMADEVRKVQDILKRTGNAGGELDGILGYVLSTLGQIANVDIASGIGAGADEASRLATNLALAAQAGRNYGKLVNKGESGPDAARRSVLELNAPGIPVGELASGAGGVYVPPPGGGGGGGGGATRDAYAEQQAALRERMVAAEKELAAIRGGEDMERYAAVQAAINAATAEGVTLTEEQTAAITSQATALFDLEEQAKSLKSAFDAITAAGESFGSAMGKALGDAAFGIGNFRDAAKAAFQDMVTSILQELGKLAASRMLQMILGGATGGGGLFGGLFGGGGGGFLSGLFGGGGFSFGLANGGVLEANTFAMTSGGRLGRVAENGPEAVLPLSRGPDGKLGVQNAGGGGGMTVNIQNNAPVEVETRQTDANTLEVIIRAAEQRVADGIARGTGLVGRSMENAYGISRRGR
jgi:tape measure domain-containing protein